MASLFEQWIATLADVASDIGARFRPKVAVEAFEQDGGGFTLRRPGGRDLGSVGADGALAARRGARLAGAAVNVALGDRHRIVDRVVYPAGTRSYLGAVIGNQLDRLAPFEDGDAVYAWREDGAAPSTDPGGDSIAVVVSIASRRRAVEAIRPLVVAGLAPARLAVGSDGVAPSVIVPLGSKGADTARLRRRVNAVVTALVILGVLGYAANWWLQRSVDRRLANAEASLALAQAAVAQAAANSTGAAASAERIGAIAADRERQNVLPILDRLSTLLPDTVYLTDFQVEGVAVRISGLAVDAAALVPLLENDPQIENVHFVAPLSRDPESARIGFDLAMTWQPKP